MQRRFLDLAVMAGLAAAYVLVGKLCLTLALVHPSATAVWPPTGMALAAFLVLGYYVWPGIFLGAFLVNITTEGSVAICLGIATGNTLEGLCGAWLVNRFAHGRYAFARAQDIFKLAVLAGLVSTTVSATCGVTSLALGGYADWARYGPIWLTWWLGDVVGDLVVAPFLILWSVNPHLRLDRWQFLEATSLLVLLLFVGQAVFVGFFPSALERYPLPYLALPLLVWAAFRFGPRAAATAVCVLSGIALWGTLMDHGPFVASTPNESLLLLQSFMGIMAVPTMVLAAVVSERKRAEVSLRQAHNELEHQVQQRTAQLASTNQALQTEIGAHRRSEARFRRLVETAGCLIVILRSDGCILYCSPFVEEFTRFRSEEVLGKNYLELFLPEADRPQAAARLQRVAAGETLRSVETRMVRKDGSNHWMLWNAEPLTDYDGRPAILAVGQDITNLKAAQERVVRVERLAAMGQLMTGLVHKSRNALQRSQVCLEMLLPEVEDRPQALNLMARLQDAQDHLHHIYQTVHAYAAPLQLHYQPCHLGTLLQEAWRHVIPVCPNPQARLQERLVQPDLRCTADPYVIQQVFHNLLENAVDAANGPIEVRVVWSEERLNGQPAIRLSIQDTGPGLTPEQRHRVFEPFFTTKAQGIGLGLAIAKRIVEAHGGRIALGDGAGPGAEFIITLPRGNL